MKVWKKSKPSNKAVLKLCLSTTVACLSLVPCEVFGVDIIAHRGASYDAPENTLPAVQLAWEQNPSGVEVDIHLARDGKIVVIHDADTKRVGGRERAVKDQSYDELRELDVGRWKGPQWERTTIPLLSEVIATIPAGKRLFIEIKCGPEVAQPLCELVEASGKAAEQFTIISFNDAALEASQRALPSIEHYLLAGYKQNPETGEFPRLEPLIERARSAGYAGLDLDHRWPIDARFVAAIHAAGLKLYTYTVNDPAIARALTDAGVDGITTDRPAWLGEQLVPVRSE